MTYEEDDDDLFGITNQQYDENEAESIAQIDKYLHFDKVRLEKQLSGENQIRPPPPPPPQPIFTQKDPSTFQLFPVIELDRALEQPDINYNPVPIKKPHKYDRNARRRLRYSENKNFSGFMAKVIKTEYEIKELIEIYNNYYGSDIDVQGFGKLKEVKNHFISTRKTDPISKKKITVLKKK